MFLYFSFLPHSSLELYAGRLSICSISVVGSENSENTPGKLQENSISGLKCAVLSARESSVDIECKPIARNRSAEIVLKKKKVKSCAKK